MGWAGFQTPIGSWCWQRASVLNRSVATDQDEGWRLHQPAKLRQGGFHESGMWPFLSGTLILVKARRPTNSGSLAMFAAILSRLIAVSLFFQAL
jgi:hypothetical protein